MEVLGLAQHPHTVYTISATGLYGAATRTITAVIDFTQDGRLLYWREY